MAVSILSYTDEEFIEYLVGYDAGAPDEANHLPYAPYKAWLYTEEAAWEILLFPYIDNHKGDPFAQHLTIERLRDSFIRGYRNGYYHG